MLQISRLELTSSEARRARDVVVSHGPVLDTRDRESEGDVGSGERVGVYLSSKVEGVDVVSPASRALRDPNLELSTRGRDRVAVHLCAGVVAVPGSEVDHVDPTEEDCRTRGGRKIGQKCVSSMEQ